MSTLATTPKPYTFDMTVKNESFTAYSSANARESMNRLAQALIVGHSDKLIALYEEETPAATEQLAQLHHYSMEIVARLAATNRAELLDVVDAANYAAAVHAKQGQLLAPSQIVSAVMNAEALGINPVRRPRKQITETADQCVKRIENETREHERLRTQNAAKGRLCLLFPISEQPRYIVHDAAVHIRIDDMPPNFERQLRTHSYDPKPADTKSLNAFLKTFDPYEDGPAAVAL